MPHRPTGLFVPAALLVLCVMPAQAQTSRNVTLLSQMNKYPGSYSACCSYVAGDGREYAAIGTLNGTSIVRLTVPTAPVEVAFINGPASQWREMKQYRDHLYIVTEGTGPGFGLQIVRMTNPDSPVLATTYTTGFTHAHTVSVDTTRALLYLNGTDNGMRQLSLASPEAPVDLGGWNTYYVHDLHLRGTTAYAACISNGLEVVLDVSTPGTFVQLAQWLTPNAFTHNSWTDLTGAYLYCTDETSAPPGTMSVWDITNLASPTLVSNYKGLPTDIVHNVHLKGDTAFVSYYTAGVRLFDITDPTTPIEFGYYDTWPGASGGYNGDWGVDPYFPSGIFIASDISTGLYVLRSSPVYGLIRGTVSDAVTTAPLPGVPVNLIGTSYSLVSYPTGKYGFSPPEGTYTPHATAYGHYAGQATAVVLNGMTTIADLPLQPLPAASLSGTVRRSTDLATLAAADVTIASSPLVTTTTAGGTYSFASVPQGLHTVTADLAGYIPASSTVDLTSNQTLDFTLTPAVWYDDVEANLGWTLGLVTDTATTGKWIRANPVGSGGGTVQPEDDHTPAPGVTCFVTANGSVGGGVGEADVDNGITTLVSPAFNLSAVTDPLIVWWQWYSNNAGSAPGQDTFKVDISNDNGVSWKRVESLLLTHNYWERIQVRVSDFVTPTATMKLRFIAEDAAPGSVVEAAIDDVEYYAKSGVTGVGDGGATAGGAAFGLERVGPSPGSGPVTARFTVGRPTPIAAAVFDAQGRLVRSLGVGTWPAGSHEVRWDGRDANDRAAGAGVYVLRLSAPGETRTARIVRVR